MEFNLWFKCLLPFIAKVPPGIAWRLSRELFHELVARPRDGAPGPDGIPYAAWRLAGIPFMDILFEAYTAFIEGHSLPNKFNECLLVFIPKGEDIIDNNLVARSPGLTRPISLSNTDSKLFALVVYFP